MRLLRLTHERPEVTPDVSVRETARIMAESHIGAIAVRLGHDAGGLAHADVRRDLRSLVAQTK